MARKSQYTLLIICEGENTEPNFFDSIRDRIMDNRYPVEDMVITIRPEPTSENDSEETESELRPKRRARMLLPAKRPVEGEISGVPPLKWVLAGQQELRQGTFNEVWVVFDNDNHPAKAQAFEKAVEFIGGKQVRIAYSSIAFEYYLLLHFEKINKAFEKSECREKKKHIYCSSGVHENDCWGERCIGGYARKYGYWEDSKDRISLFPLVEDKLETGFWNAAWLRHESNLKFASTIFYDRNPFVTTDSIVKRLTGYENHTFAVILIEQELEIENELKISFLKDLSIKVTNISKTAIIVPLGSFSRILIPKGNEEKIGERKILQPGEEIAISFAPEPQNSNKYEYHFTYGSSHIMLQIEE
jgi:hypothetical protein